MSSPIPPTDPARGAAIPPGRLRLETTARPPPAVTQLLAASRDGDDAARRVLWDSIYSELQGLARRQLAGEAFIHRDHATSLVHQAFLRLTAGDAQAWANRQHFFAAAVNVMREIRIDDARKRKRQKRGSGRAPLSLSEPAVSAGLFSDDPEDVLGVHETLDRYAQIEPRKAEIVKLRYFAGMTVPEVADALDISPRTVDNEWRIARAWLYRALKDESQAENDLH